MSLRSFDAHVQSEESRDAICHFLPVRLSTSVMRIKIPFADARCLLGVQKSSEL